MIVSPGDRVLLTQGGHSPISDAGVPVTVVKVFDGSYEKWVEPASALEYVMDDKFDVHLVRRQYLVPIPVTTSVVQSNDAGEASGAASSS